VAERKKGTPKRGTRRKSKTAPGVIKTRKSMLWRKKPSIGLAFGAGREVKEETYLVEGDN